jgi:hypothetical protein
MSTSSFVVDVGQVIIRLSCDRSLPVYTVVSKRPGRGEKRKRRKDNRSGGVNSGIDPNSNDIRLVQPGNPSTLSTTNSIDRPQATRNYIAPIQSSKSHRTYQSSLATAKALMFLLLVLPSNVFSWGRSLHNGAFSMKTLRTRSQDSPLTFLWKATRQNPIQMSQNQSDKSKSIRVLGVCGGIGSGKVSRLE